MLTLRRFTTICLVLLVVAAALAPGCSRQTEEDKVKKVITDAQTAVEEKEIRKVVNALADTYSDPRGFNRDDVRRVLLGLFPGTSEDNRVSDLSESIRRRGVGQGVVPGRPDEREEDGLSRRRHPRITRRLPLRCLIEQDIGGLEGHLGQLGAGGGRVKTVSGLRFHVAG